jgi:thiol-disulfide isomerase/thioredoxin
MAKPYTLMKFGAPWCSPCASLAKQKILEKIAKDHQNLNVEVLDVIPPAPDETEDAGSKRIYKRMLDVAETTKKQIEETGLKNITYQSFEDDENSKADEWQVESLPCFILLNPEGAEVARFDALSARMEQKIVAWLKENKAI